MATLTYFIDELTALDGAAIYNGRLAVELYLELHREDVLSAYNITEADVKQVKILWSTEKAPSWEVIEIENQAFSEGKYKSWDGHWRICIETLAGKIHRHHAPAFLWDLPNALKLAPPNRPWVLRGDPKNVDRPFGFAFDGEETTWHASMATGCVIASLRYRLKYGDEPFNPDVAPRGAYVEDVEMPF